MPFPKRVGDSGFRAAPHGRRRLHPPGMAAHKMVMCPLNLMSTLDECVGHCALGKEQIS